MITEQDKVDWSAGFNDAVSDHNQERKTAAYEHGYKCGLSAKLTIHDIKTKGWWLYQNKEV